MKLPRVSLDHWRVLEAVIEYGGFAQAAEKLHRSQSSVSYAIAKLQEQLGLQMLSISGRKAVLTEAGKIVLQRAHRLLNDAVELETFAVSLNQGREAEIQLVVDAAFPNVLLVEALQRFAQVDCGTRVQLREVILSGADEALSEGEADLVIAADIPPQRLADELMEIEFIAVAHPKHPLHSLQRELNVDDLLREIQIIIRDSGHIHPRDVGWQQSEHRWTVSSIETAVTLVKQGLGYSWLPAHEVRAAIDAGNVKILPLREGQTYHASLYLIYGQPDNIGPATQELAELIRNVVTNRGS